MRKGERPWLLDLFCGAGGAGEGYRRAGFHVVGVDIVKQKHNPHEFYQDDALRVLDVLIAGEEWHGYRLADFQAIHASPPCQGYSIANNIWSKNHPLLIDPVRVRLKASGVPWVIENVRMPGKFKHAMPSAIVLCGDIFGLKVYRHRYFESSEIIFSPGPCTHPAYLLPGYVSIFGDIAKGRQTGNKGNRKQLYPLSYARKAMGIEWMTWKEICEAIPPAYTQWIGAQLMAVIDQEAA